MSQRENLTNLTTAKSEAGTGERTVGPSKVTIQLVVDGMVVDESTIDRGRIGASLRLARGSGRTARQLSEAVKAALEGDGDVVVTIDSGKLSDERELGSARRPTTDDVTRRLLPEFPVATPGQAVQAQRNAEARLELLDEFGAFTSDQISERRSNAKNVHALANRWKNEGRVFAVEHGGQWLYPGFRIDLPTLTPKAVVA